MTFLLQAAQEPVTASTIVQAVLLGLIIVFICSFVTAGFVAKKINNISGASYTKAFLATALKNVFGVFVLFVMAGYLKIDYRIALGVVTVVVPILVYKITFACPRIWEAILVWFPVTLVEGLVGYVLTVVGIVTLGDLGL